MPHDNLPSGVIQGPDGKFESIDQETFVDYEVVPLSVTLNGDGHTSSVSSFDWSNHTEFQGLEVLDMSDLLDRHRVAHLIEVDAGLVAYSYQNATDPSLSIVAAELSASPALSAATISPEGDREAIDDTESINGDLDTVEGEVVNPDTLDVPIRPLVAFASMTYEDATDGAGGGAGGPVDRATGPVPGTWQFDRRDELYVNGTIAQAGGFAATVEGQLYATLAFGIEDTTQ